MKQIQLNLRKNLLLVELTENKELIGIKDKTLLIAYEQRKNECIGVIDVPFECFFVGRFPDIPEIYWYGVVELEETQGAYPLSDVYCLDYVSGNYDISAVKDSVISAIKAKGWYVDGNPLTNPHEQEHWCREWKDKAIKHWQQAQERVIDLSRVWVFEKKEINNG